MKIIPLCLIFDYWSSEGAFPAAGEGARVAVAAGPDRHTDRGHGAIFSMKALFHSAGRTDARVFRRAPRPRRGINQPPILKLTVTKLLRK